MGAHSDAPTGSDTTPASADAREPSWQAIPWGRAAVAALALAWILLGPAYPQLLGGSDRVLRAWTMFSGIGLGTTAVEYWSVEAGGVRTRLDWRAALARSKSGAPAGRRRSIGSAQEAVSVGETLCEALGAQAEVHVTLRVAASDGWKVVLDRDLCQVIPFPTSARDAQTARKGR